MISNGDLERLIAEKRREIENEKIVLGLSPAADANNRQNSEDKENARIQPGKKSVRVGEKVLGLHHDNKGQEETHESHHLDEIPAGLERYIRRYLGLPVMLKAGEFSPNNPLVRAERQGGDVLLGLGEYERRRNTLRKIRQQQYREYLDQQAKKKQEAKEQAERERREREQREREREEERERVRQQLERDKLEAEQRRASVCYVPAVSSNTTNSYRNKVDTGVQVGVGRPLSVAVQTDDAELYRPSPSPRWRLTQAERELSPRTVEDHETSQHVQGDWTRAHWDQPGDLDKHRRRSYGDFDERSSTAIKKTSRDKLISDLRHTYMPSIFDAEAIHMRNLQAEKEAAERRQFYQQELKNQILEQQRIREERKTREKMLEQAEMRRLEEQLRMLRVAQEREVGKQRDITAAMKENTSEFDKKRSSLQKEIDYEHQKLLRATTQPKRHIPTAISDTTSQLPTFYSKEKRPPYSTNIPDNSIFSPNYDVDSYLRKNLNPKNEFSSKLDLNKSEKHVIVEKALVHGRPKEKNESKFESRFMKNVDVLHDETPIPVLRHSPKEVVNRNEETMSEGMQLVDNKWKVPAVQKNILKSQPNEDGKNVSILTQLGSIRRQLQLEQMRLDNMMSKCD